jgi:hypothetical protein
MGLFSVIIVTDGLRMTVYLYGQESGEKAALGKDAEE